DRVPGRRTERHAARVEQEHGDRPREEPRSDGGKARIEKRTAKRGTSRTRAVKANIRHSLSSCSLFAFSRSRTLNNVRPPRRVRDAVTVQVEPRGRAGALVREAPPVVLRPRRGRRVRPAQAR